MNDTPRLQGKTTAIDLAHEAEFLLGGLQVLPSTREVRSPRGTVTVEPRVMQAMVRLFHARGAVVSRDDLIQSCWGGRVVSEDAINRCIAKVRQLAENHGETWFTVETVPRVGYRLVLAGQSAIGKPAGGRLSICVLPFANLSDDPRQEFLADGLTADIITDLSRWPSLAVLSRHTTFRFKGQHVDPKRIGQELGARYVVEGAVRRMDDRLRISANLTDAETGNHIWSERFDRPVADFFAVQDEVVRTIVGTLVGRVYVSEGDRLRSRHPSSLAAYELTLRGNTLPWDDPASAAEALQCFEMAIKLDPDYGFPYSLKATLVKWKWERDLSASMEIIDECFALAQRGVALADNQSTSHAALGTLYYFRQSFDLALHHYERAVEINPNNQWNLADLGGMLAQIGRPEEGLERLRDARRADPFFGPSWYWRVVGATKFVLRRYDEALADFERVQANSPPYALAMMAGCSIKLGQAERAKDLIAQCFAGQPQATVDDILVRVPYQRTEDTEHLRACLLEAGAPQTR
jgi:TolB-like protein/DNA-binding winged helix-turn-helix (wHTH) protein